MPGASLPGLSSVAVSGRFVYQVGQPDGGGDGSLERVRCQGSGTAGTSRAAPGVPGCRAVWSGSIGAVATVESSPAVTNGVVYVGSDDNKLYAFDADGCGAATCEPLWTATTGGDIDSSPAVANGVVYVGSEDNKLYAFDADGCGAATCRPLWTATTGGNVDSSPAVANGVVYVGSDDNKLYAFAADGCGAGHLRTAVDGDHRRRHRLLAGPGQSDGLRRLGRRSALRLRPPDLIRAGSLRPAPPRRNRRQGAAVSGYITTTQSLRGGPSCGRNRPSWSSARRGDRHRGRPGALRSPPGMAHAGGGVAPDREHLQRGFTRHSCP